MSDEKGGLDGEIRLDSNDGQSISLPRRSVVLSQVANAALESGICQKCLNLFMTLG